MRRLFDWLRNQFGKAKPMLETGPAYYRVALKERGVTEIFGKKHNKRILEYHAHTNLHATEDEVPWCASFVCWCLEQAGYNHPHSARARDFCEWGVTAHWRPAVGDVVVLSRGRNPKSGHVGFFVKKNKSYVWVLGGNQSNKVCVQKFSLDRVLDYRTI